MPGADAARLAEILESRRADISAAWLDAVIAELRGRTTRSEAEREQGEILDACWAASATAGSG